MNLILTQKMQGNVGKNNVLIKLGLTSNRGMAREIKIANKLSFRVPIKHHLGCESDLSNCT